MKPRQRRFLLLGAAAGGAATAVALVLNAFRSNLVFFFSPTQVVARESPAAHTFRLGGLVVAGSLKRRGTDVEFGVTDSAHTVTVQYRGLLPDLFKEGQGVVAQGKLGGNGVFLASDVLAKHDENYMPPEAAEALARARASRAGSTDTPQARP